MGEHQGSDAPSVVTDDEVIARVNRLIEALEANAARCPCLELGDIPGWHIEPWEHCSNRTHREEWDWSNTLRRLVGRKTRKEEARVSDDQGRA